MVLLGYGSNNRRRVLQKVEWTVRNSDRKHLEQRVLPAIHQLVIASVVIPLRTWGKQEEVKTAWFLTRLPHSVGSWRSLDRMNGDCRDGCLKKKKIRSWKIGGWGWGGGWGWRISRNREYCKMGESLEVYTNTISCVIDKNKIWVSTLTRFNCNTMPQLLLTLKVKLLSLQPNSFNIKNVRRSLHTLFPQGY